ncbi:MAG: putative ubiquitin-RnfH superfamily antitoxin RatB of RatAB toxin-antitoxin module [Saprospiraceae bacterium]|jgi:putative ubiquitin-RnfH superfamily antitoxin RatB of RatAB toxin-antitoxin module
MLVYVSYATPESQEVLEVTAAPQITAEQAIVESGILAKYKELNIDNLVIGIYGKKWPKETPLKALDRVEIYRPLHLSPVEARRLRAENVKKQSA